MERTDPPFEVHLQNGFRDDPVEIERNGVVEAEVTATTRFQIGAADVIPIDGEEGDELTIRLPAHGDQVSLRLSRTQRYVLVQNEGGQLRVDASEQSPRYA